MKYQDFYEFEDYSDLDLIMYEEQERENYNDMYYEYFYIGAKDE